MRKVFEVELASENGCTELTVPATPYALLDALEQLWLTEGEAPGWEILQSDAFPGISMYLDRRGTLSELNALAQRLAALDEQGLAIVEGLALMEPGPQGEPIPLPRLIDLAYSTDCCHLVEGVVTDAQLGRFCAENGFVPEADDLPDAAFALLDFARIGRQFRETEGGVFTRVGYVQRHDELKQVYNTLDPDCYHWLPRVDLEASAKEALTQAGVSEKITQSGGVSLRSYGAHLLEKQGYTMSTPATTKKRGLDDYDAEYDATYQEYHNMVEEKVAGLTNPMEIIPLAHSFVYRYPSGREIMVGDVARSDTDTAIYVLMRQAGECNDRRLEQGDYYITDTERENLQTVAAAYAHTILVINVGGHIDLA